MIPTENPRRAAYEEIKYKDNEKKMILIFYQKRKFIQLILILCQ